MQNTFTVSLHFSKDDQSQINTDVTNLTFCFAIWQDSCFSEGESVFENLARHWAQFNQSLTIWVNDSLAHASPLFLPFGGCRSSSVLKSSIMRSKLCFGILSITLRRQLWNSSLSLSLCSSVRTQHCMIDIFRNLVWNLAYKMHWLIGSQLSDFFSPHRVCHEKHYSLWGLLVTWMPLFYEISTSILIIYLH